MKTVANEHDLVTEGCQGLQRELGNFRPTQITDQLFIRVEINKENFELRSRVARGEFIATIITQQSKAKSHGSNNNALIGQEAGEGELGSMTIYTAALLQTIPAGHTSRTTCADVRETIKVDGRHERAGAVVIIFWEFRELGSAGP